MMILVFRRGMGDDPRMVQTHLCPEKEGVVSCANRPSRATPGVFGSGTSPAPRAEPSRRRRFICEPSVPRDPGSFR